MDGSQIAGVVLGIVLMIVFPLALFYVAMKGIYVAWKIHKDPIGGRR